MARCVCQHTEDAHQHYRDGTDCGACGPLCARYRPADDPGTSGRRFTLGDALWGAWAGLCIFLGRPHDPTRWK